MALLKTIYDLQNGNSEFRNRITGGLCVVANEVMAENILTANHDARLKWALDILRNPENAAVSMTKAVAADPLVSDRGDLAEDDELLTSIRKLVNCFAV